MEAEQCWMDAKYRVKLSSLLARGKLRKAVETGRVLGFPAVLAHSTGGKRTRPVLVELAPSPVRSALVVESLLPRPALWLVNLLRQSTERALVQVQLVELRFPEWKARVHALSAGGARMWLVAWLGELHGTPG